MKKKWVSIRFMITRFSSLVTKRQASLLLRASGIIFIAVAAARCQPTRNDARTINWKEGQGPLPSLYQEKEFAADKTLMSQNEIIEHRPQTWGPARVRNGYAKLIKSSTGKPIEGRAYFYDLAQNPSDESLSNFKYLEKLDKNKFLFVQNAIKLGLIDKENEIVGTPELVITSYAGRHIPSYAVDVLDKKTSQVERYYFNTLYRLFEKEKLSNDFEATGWIYTLKNNLEIEEVLFQNLILGKTLQSQTIRVDTDFSDKATIRNAPWRFDTEDPRFDQVQVFYFIQKGLDFFAKALEFTLPLSIEVQTSYGYPESKNAAFTYQNQIRLGRGDNIIYKGLAQDPSVVLHELSHILVTSLAQLPSQNEGGSLNEAFADFFAASYLNDPIMGKKSFVQGPYKRNLTDLVTYTEKNNGLYHDSLIVSGTLWSIRQELGADIGQKFGLKILSRLTPQSNLIDFATTTKDLAKQDLNDGQYQIVLNQLRKHQWPIE